MGIRARRGAHAPLLTQVMDPKSRSGEPEEGMELDVRKIPPRERHPRIFALFDRLMPGEGFVLVNDHDPKPLYYQFQAERPGQVDWTYLEEGPEVWRVRIAKKG